jgi:hypothetical protein
MISTKIKKSILLSLVSTTFILSLVSYAPVQQQAFGQGMFEPERNQSPPPLIMEEANNATDIQQESTTTARQNDNNQQIILNDITIPITPETSLSLELPDSKITVQPNE